MEWRRRLPEPELWFPCGIAGLEEEEGGSGVRTSHLFPGDITNELVRHFLIETSPRGVKLKGCPNEPNFGECPPQRASHMQAWVRRALPLRDCQSRAVGCLGEPQPLLLPPVPV